MGKKSKKEVVVPSSTLVAVVIFLSHTWNLNFITLEWNFMFNLPLTKEWLMAEIFYKLTCLVRFEIVHEFRISYALLCGVGVLF